MGSLLLFSYAEQNLALPSKITRQVLSMEHITTLPGHSGALLGLMTAAGRAVPVLNIHHLMGLPEMPVRLVLICEAYGEYFGLPIHKVIGFISDEDAPISSDLLTEETILGGVLGDGNKGKVINPDTLLSTVRSRLTPA